MVGFLTRRYQMHCTVHSLRAGVKDAAHPNHQRRRGTRPTPTRAMLHIIFLYLMVYLESIHFEVSDRVPNREWAVNIRIGIWTHA